MNSNKPMAIPMSEWREEQAKTDRILRGLKLAAAALCILGAASQWQQITSLIDSTKTTDVKSIVEAPVSSHRKSFGVAKEPNTLRESVREVVQKEVVSAAKTISNVAEKVGFHRNSEHYRAKPILEDTFLTDHGAQKEVAKMIAATYRVSMKTSTLIVAKTVIEAKKQALDPLLLLGLIGQESSFNKNAQSNYGAQGLVQVVPIYHADSMKKLGVTNILEASVGKQIQLGAVVFKGFLGDDNKPVELALQHYNQGPNARTIDPKLKYATGVLNKREAFANVVHNYQSGRSESPKPYL